MFYNGHGVKVLVRWCGAACLAASAVWAGSLAPARLETGARSDPVGIDVARPVLSWRLASTARGERQAAYQILAASTRETLAADRGDLWDTRRVNSEETSGIPYAGAALRSFQECWWKVRVWGTAGPDPSQWSAPARWTMALVDPGDRRGGWIAWPETKLDSGPLPVFRKEFAADKPMRRALLLASGAGFHELRLNGQKVGDHVLAPAWSNYRTTVYYETFDVTRLLRPGTNAVGILLGNGFYNVAGGRYAKYTGSFGQPRLWAQIHLEFEDGTTRDIATDGTWKTAEGPLTFSCIYGGEDYDARLEPAGWDRAGFDDSKWRRPAGMEAPGGVLRAQSSPPLRVEETFTPVKVTHPQPGITVYDLGRNFSGWPYIEVTGAAGARVKMTPGELLTDGGLVTQRQSGGPMYFRYTLRGGGIEEWSPRFSYYGFRYVQVEIEGQAEVRKLEGCFVHLAADRVGRFHSSNDLLNRIHALIDAAVRSNLQHVLTDCPHREKLGWLEQSYLMGPSLLYNWDLRTFLPKVIRDIREAQTVDGLIPDIAPEYVVFGAGFRDSPEWGSAGVLLPWMDWQWYGDRRPLEDSYAAMQRYSGYLASKAEDGVLAYGLGDWYDIGPGPPGPSKLTPRGLTATATWFADLRILARAARILGREVDAQNLERDAAGVRAAFDKAFYRPAGNTYATGSQTSLAMPLALGLAPDSARPGLVEALVADIRRKENHTSAGDIGYHYVIGALLDAGRSDVLYDMATRTDSPSYGAQLAAGATSLTEAWDADPGSSQNHLMLGHIEEWFYAGLAGIRPDPAVPGLRRLRIAPQVVGDLTSVDASWDTFRGTVSVRWRIEAGVWKGEVELPPGITAEVWLPKAERPVEIGSGSHQWQVTGWRTPPAASPR